MESKNLEEVIDSIRSSSFDDDFESRQAICSHQQARILFLIAARSSLTFIICLYIFCVSLKLGSSEVLPVYPGSGSLKGTIYKAKPGDVVSIHPGTYRGGVWIFSIDGSENEPIYIQAADPANPPVISGGSAGIQFSACSHIVIRDIVFNGQFDNGINIDDNGERRKGNYFACKNITLERILVKKVRGVGNNDGIKLSGARDFAVKDCTVEGWGDYGCGIDMVACTNGKIIDCRFDGRSIGGWGIQGKGGSSSLLVKDCQVKNVTHRGIQIGGVTGPEFFPEKEQNWEARGIEVKSCDVYGGDASISIIHAKDVLIQNCRSIHPKKWFFRFLKENPSTRFQPSRNVLIEGCLCVANGNRFIGPVNSGIGLNDDSVRFADNIWFHETFPKWDLRLGLPSLEQRSISGVEPPGSFLREDFVFTESRFEQLRSLLSYEIILQANDKRLKWILTLGLVSFMWFGLWIYAIGSAPDALPTLQVRSQSVVIGNGLILMLAILFVVLHMDLSHLGSDSDSEFPTVSDDQFAILIRSIQLGFAIFLINAVLDGFTKVFFASFWTSIICGVVVAIIIHGIESLVHYLGGRIAFDPNHLSIDITVGFFSGVIAHGFSRSIRAFTIRSSRSTFLLSGLDGLLLTLCLLALFSSFIFYPLAFDGEFLYDRFRSYGSNMGTFTRAIDLNALCESLLFCIPFTWAVARKHRQTLGGLFSSFFSVAMVVVLLQSINFFRIGRFFLLSQTCLLALFALVTWVVANLTHHNYSTISEKKSFLKLFHRIDVLLVVVPWALFFWVSQYR